MDLTSKAALEDALSQANSQQTRAQAGVAADLQSRGQLNSGADLVMSQNAAQSEANQARASAGTDAAAAASQRRLAAINDAASLDSQLRGEDFSEADTANAAKDARDQLNQAARQQAQYYNAGLPQQQFSEAAMQKAGRHRVPQRGNGLAAAMGAAGTSARQGAAGVGAAAGQIGSLYTAPPAPPAPTYTPPVNSNDPNSVFTYGTNYGGSSPDEFNQWPGS